MTVTRFAKTAALALAKERPEIGKVRAARELRSRGIHVSPSGVHAIWKRNGLATSYQRLVSRARNSDSSGPGLSDLQRALLKRRKITRRVIVKAATNPDSPDHPRREAAIAGHLAELVKHTDVPGVTGASLFHAAPPALQRRLNRERDLYEARFRELISALPLPTDVDRTLLRLTLLGAVNWTRIWY